MSSRILPQKERETAAAMVWRPAGAASAGPPQAEPYFAAQDGARAVDPGASGWDQLRVAEARCRELEAQLPAREQQARQAGQREGEAAATARWEAAQERLARSIAEVGSLRARLRRQAEEDVVQLAMAIAHRILRRELSVDPEALRGVVKAALDRVDQRDVQRVRVRPEDAPALSAWLDRIGSPHRIEVAPDPGLERGGVVIETGRGQLDASLETQLEEVERGFADLLKRR